VRDIEGDRDASIIVSVASSEALAILEVLAVGHGVGVVEAHTVDDAEVESAPVAVGGADTVPPIRGLAVGEVLDNPDGDPEASAGVRVAETQRDVIGERVDEAEVRGVEDAD
jgi:hypothetical protein